MNPIARRAVSALIGFLTSFGAVLQTMPPDTTLAMIPIGAWVACLLSAVTGGYAPKGAVVEVSENTQKEIQQ